MSAINQFCMEVGAIAAAIDVSGYASPLIGTPLEPFLSPLVRGDFIIGRKLLLELSPEKVLGALVASKLIDDRILAAGSPACTSEQFQLLAADRDNQVLISLASNPALPEKIAQQLAARVPKSLASSLSCPQNILIDLARNRDSEVRISVAENKNCSLELARDALISCAGDKWAQIRQRVVECWACDQEVLLAVDGQKREPSRGDHFGLLLAIARHRDCHLIRRSELFRSLPKMHDSYIIESGEGRYSISDASLDLAALKECPDDVRAEFLYALAAEPDIRYALEVAILPVCPPELLIKLTDRLKKSKSKSVEARLGSMREAGLIALRSAAIMTSGADSPQSVAMLPDPIDWNELGRRAKSGESRPIREVLSDPSSPPDLRDVIHADVMDRVFRSPDISAVMGFDFNFSRPFSGDRKNPLAFLRFSSAVESKDIRKALRSANWLDRAALTFCRKIPAAAVDRLRNDSHDVVRGLAAAQR